MKIIEKVVLPERLVELVKGLECDVCHEVIPTGSHIVHEVNVSCKTGVRYLGGPTELREVAPDLCFRCFRSIVIPALVAAGCRIVEREVQE